MSKIDPARISSEALEYINKLPTGHRIDVLQFLEENPRQKLNTKCDVLHAYLMWNGIIGYTDCLYSMIKAW